METLVEERRANGAHPQGFLPSLRPAYGKILLRLFLATAILALSGCGGGGSPSSPPIRLSISGNWQFTMAQPADGSFLGGLEGGFLLQNNGSVTGGATYSVSLPNFLIPCNSGSAMVNGTISGQTVNLTAVAGTQTFTLSGTLSLAGSTMTGSYASTAGTAGNGSPCGTAQTGLQWSAVLVPPLAGAIEGSFHSAGGAAGLNEQEFFVSGGLTQAANTGASSAIITGNLSFLNPLTNVSDYPCLTLAYVYGQISGNSVSLQITGSDRTELGLIGEPVGSLGGTGVNPVTFDSAQGGYILHGAGPSYSLATSTCPGNFGNVDTAGDFGNICLALSGNACQQPITLTPSALIFLPQAVGSTPSTQIITLANASGKTLGSVTLNLANDSGAANFTETDGCGLNGLPSQGQPFDLSPGQSCEVSILFSPLETCAAGTPPDQCPSPLNATLTVTSPNNEMIFTVPITGTAFSEDAVLTPRLDFDAQGVLEASLLQLVSFSNRSGHPVQNVASSNNRNLEDPGSYADIY